MNNKNNTFKKIANVFIVNRELGFLSILLVVFFGAVGFLLMPKQYNPEIVAPAFRITTVFPHATAEEVYELVTRPMENKVREISLVDDIYSQTSAGLSVVTVTFDIGSDKHGAKIDLVQRLRSNMGEKPMGAIDPTVEEVDVDNVPIVSYAILSEKFSSEALRSFSLDLADRIKRVENVSDIIVRGGSRSDLTVFVDVEKLQERGVSISDIRRAIISNNIHVLTVMTDSDPYDIPVRVYGNIASAEQLSKMVVSQTERGVVRIEDIGRVEMQEMVQEHFVRFDDKETAYDAVLVGVAKQNGANATTVAREIHAEMSKLRAQGFIPSHVQVHVVGDDGVVAQEAIGGLTVNLIQSIIIVVLVLLLFLNTRSAMVVAIAIPLSLLSVFALGFLFDQTINRITLFALILSLGLLVDNATVVVENMHRLIKLRRNDPMSDVITDAVAEVGSGLVMSTITTVIAFIPMAFVTGMMGPYMGPIPFFVPAAIVASLIVALTINPFIGYYLLQQESQKENFVNRVQKRVKNGVEHAEKMYGLLLERIFKSKKQENMIMISVVILLIVSMALPLVTAVKFRMLPKADRDQFYIYVDAQYGTNIAQTDRVAQRIAKEIRGMEHIANLQTTVGAPPIVDFNGLFKGSDSRVSDAQATIKVNLVSHKNRNLSSENIAVKVREALASIALQENVNIKIVEDPPGPPVLATYHIKIQGDDRAQYPILRDIARDLASKSRQIAGVVDIDISAEEHGVEQTYEINAEEATRLGVSVQDIVTAMEMFSQGAHIDLYHDTLINSQKFMEQHYISLRSESNDRKDSEAFDRISVRISSGDQVLLSALLRETMMPVDETILMDAQYPTVYVSGEMQDRSIVYASIDLLKYLVTAYRLPGGGGVVDDWDLFGVHYVDRDGQRYYVRIGGEWQLTLEVFRDFGIAFGVAIFLIYFVLVAQFRSLKIPLYVMATIPLALVGVLPGFMILYLVKGTYFNATSMIGVIALAGIVVNNAIIYLEYVFDELNKGTSVDSALIEAGRTRLLPIALTSLTTILGSLTIVSDPVWEGLAWAIITGLSLSTFLTLIVLPIIYRRYEKSV